MIYFYIKKDLTISQLGNIHILCYTVSGLFDPPPLCYTSADPPPLKKYNVIYEQEYVQFSGICATEKLVPQMKKIRS